MPVIPKEESATFQRWQMDAFDKPTATPAAKAPTAPLSVLMTEVEAEVVNDFKFPTAEDLEHIQTAARAEGHQTGFETGQAEGFAAGMAEAKLEAERLATCAINFQTALAQLDQQVADQLLELALEIAQQVVRSTLSKEPERILPIIREAIAALPLHHGNIVLHLHPDDALLLHKQLGNQLAQSGWHLIEDPAVSAGGCLLRAGASEIDATLETRWRRVIEGIGQEPPAETS